MASNPFGITQVDVPSMLSLYEGVKRSRLEDLYRQKMFERQERTDAREEQDYQRQTQAREAIQRGAKPDEVIALDPKLGFDYASHAATLEKSKREEIARRADDVGSAALYLSELTPDQMAAQWDGVLDRLIERGYTDLEAYKGKPNRAALGPIIAASQEAVKAYLAGQQKDDEMALRERQIGISQGNLDLARQREARVTKWGPQPLIGMIGAGSIPGGRGQNDTSDLDY
jgi:hypothetical protein